MKIIYFSLLFFLFVFCNFKPYDNPRTILILVPNQITIDSSLQMEFKQLDSNTIEISKEYYLEEKELQKMPNYKDGKDNLKTIIKATNDFIQDLTAANSITLSISNYLTQVYVDYHYQDFLVLPMNIKSVDSKTDLKEFAEKYKTKFVLNFPSIDIFFKSNKRIANIKAQLYDTDKNDFVIDKVFDGDALNRGGYFMCEDSTISCCISNAASKIFTETLKIID